MSEQWVEKYRPESLDKIAGNKKAIKELQSWATIWKNGKSAKIKKKGALLYGPPGVGKTTVALALAHDYGWDALELNASDKRNADAVRTIIGYGSTTNAFSEEGTFSSKSRRRLIIMDEADNLHARKDRGGINALIEVLKKTKQPIVLIANDSYKLTKKKAIKDLCVLIEFEHLSEDDIVAALRHICDNEKITLPDGDLPLKTIAINSAGDMRSAINDLQSIAMGKSSITEMDAESLSKRDLSPGIESAVRTILTTNDPYIARGAPRDLDVEPGYLLYYLDHNLPRAYDDIRDREAGFDILSLADIYLARVNRRSVYTFWSYANDLMTVGLVLTAKRKKDTFKVQFPYVMSLIGRAKGANAARNSITAKLGRYAHVPPNQTRLSLFPPFRDLYRKNSDFRTAMTSALRLDEKEIRYLLKDWYSKEESEREAERLLSLVTDETEKIPAALMGKGRRKGKKEEKNRIPAAPKEKTGVEKGEKEEEKEDTGERGEDKKSDREGKGDKRDKGEKEEKKAKLMTLTDF